MTRAPREGDQHLEEEDEEVHLTGEEDIGVVVGMEGEEAIELRRIMGGEGDSEMMLAMEGGEVIEMKGTGDEMSGRETF